MVAEQHLRRGSRLYQDDGKYAVRLSPARAPGRNDRWLVEAWYRGHRTSTLVREMCGGSDPEGDAEAFAAVLWADYQMGAHAVPVGPPRSLGELMSRFLARETSKRGRPLSPQTRRTYESQLQAWVAVAGEDRPLEHLTRRQVLDAVQRPRSQASQRQYLVAIRAVVRFAVAHGWLTQDVTHDVVVDPGPQHIRPYLQPDEWPAYLDACPPAWRIRAGFILETGLRAAEASALHWSWIQRGVGMTSVHVPARCQVSGFGSKGLRVRAIPCSDGAMRWLEEARQRWGEQGFVLHAASSPIGTSNWRADSVAACALAGLQAVDTHGLRRSAGVRWLTAGVDIYTVSLLLGHKSVTTTERSYAGIAHGRVSEAIRLVNQSASVPRIGAWRRQVPAKTGPGGP
ncbi:MAG: hypothetical protein AMXMBFR77_27810 [Phycisphaerales bacterium]